MFTGWFIIYFYLYWLFRSKSFRTITISYHNLPFRTTKLQFRTICILHHNHFVPQFTISYHKTHKNIMFQSEASESILPSCVAWKQCHMITWLISNVSRVSTVSILHVLIGAVCSDTGLQTCWFVKWNSDINAQGEGSAVCQTRSTPLWKCVIISHTYRLNN